jgi:vacuolar-type H+-ATPase subunit C/Vma6
VSEARFAKRYGSAAPEAVLIKGGGSATQRLMAYREIPTVEQIVRDLHNTPFGEALARALSRYNEKRSLSVFQDELEGQIAREHYALFMKDPLSIGIPVAYLAALVNEVRNLRLIGRGKAAGWKREDIEKELRLWQN